MTKPSSHAATLKKGVCNIAIIRHFNIAILKYCLQNTHLCPPGPVQQGGEGLGQPGLQVREPLLTISLKNIREGGKVGGWDTKNGKVIKGTGSRDF